MPHLHGDRDPASGGVDQPSVNLVAGAIFFLLVIIYLSTASWGVHQSRDPIANALPAWRLAIAGTFAVDGYETPWLSLDQYGEGLFRWYVVHEGHSYSFYPPGTAVVGAPFYGIAALVSPSLRTEFAPWPAAVAASVFAAAAVTLFYVLLTRLVERRIAIRAALIAGLATPVWAVSADALWPHGPAQLWLVLAMFGMAAQRHGLSGLTFGAVVLTRPLALVAAVVAGTAEGLQRNSLRPTLLIGAGTGLGLLGLVTYNALILGTPSLTGGYGSYPIDTLAALGFTGYLRNLGGALFSQRGIFVITPSLILLLPGLRTAWRVAPGWVRSAALAGLAYLLVKMAFTLYTGGAAYFGYRLPLQALTLMAPLFVLSWETWVKPRAGARKVFAVLVLGAFTFQAMAAVYPQVPIT
jgi:hypothetical protein